MANSLLPDQIPHLIYNRSAFPVLSTMEVYMPQPAQGAARRTSTGGDSSKRRLKLIFNAHADRGHAWEVARSLEPSLARRGETSWAATEYPGHATELALSATRDGYDMVVAIGGDGTVHEVVNGLMQVPAGQRPLLGAVPVGSGNDFCANLGLPRDPELAVLRLFEGQPRSVDVATIQDNNGQREFWNNTVSIGFGAAVAIHAYQIRRLRGFPMYLWAVIKTIVLNHDAPRMVIETDNERIEENVLLISLNNGPREGGGFLTSPDALLDDGSLNYAMIRDVSRLMMFRLIPEVMRGTHGRFEPVRLGEFRKFRLRSQAPIPVHTDGEIFADFYSGVTELDVEVLPGALEVIS